MFVCFFTKNLADLLNTRWRAMHTVCKQTILRRHGHCHCHIRLRHIRILPKKQMGSTNSGSVIPSVLISNWCLRCLCGHLQQSVWSIHEVWNTHVNIKGDYSSLHMLLTKSSFSGGASRSSPQTVGHTDTVSSWISGYRLFTKVTTSVQCRHVQWEIDCSLIRKESLIGIK